MEKEENHFDDESKDQYEVYTSTHELLLFVYDKVQEEDFKRIKKMIESDQKISEMVSNIKTLREKFNLKTFEGFMEWRNTYLDY